MLRFSRNFHLYKQLELHMGILRKPSGFSVAMKRNMSNVEPTKKKGGIGIGLPFGIIVTGTMASTIFYAKSDSEFREWLDKQVPGTSEFIRILCLEDDISYSQRVLDLISDIQSWFLNLFSSSDPEPLKKEFVPVPKEEIAPLAAALVDSPKPPKEKPQAPKTPTPQKLIDFEKEISKTSAVAIEHYNKAVNAIRDQAQYIQELVASDVGRVSSNVWSNIKEKSKIRDDLMTTADENAHIAETKILELESMISKGELEGPKNVLEETQKNLARMRDDIEKACQKAEEEMFNTNITKDLWPRVEEARRHWQEELNILFPNLDLKEKNLNILADEIRQFILYSLVNVQYYQKELGKLQISAEKKLREAIERATTSGNSEELIAAAVQEEIESERRCLELQYQKKSLELRAACEQKIRKQLRLQTEIQSDYLRDSIRLREIELERMHQRELHKVLTEEHTQYQLKLAALVGRLKGIDDGLKAHAQIDKSAQQAQDLWTSCQMFYRNIDPHSDRRSAQPLSSFIDTIQKTAESDELVTQVVKSIPNEALSRGVYPIKVLRERFLKVEKVARTLAVVPEDGSSLPMFFLSWIQGILIWKGSDMITEAELNDQPTAHELLNNYDILSRARYWVDHGDLLQALRYMNLLSGASKSIAKDWMNEARLYLECQQAATVLLHHASAKGLLYS